MNYNKARLEDKRPVAEAVAQFSTGYPENFLQGNQKRPQWKDDILSEAGRPRSYLGKDRFWT